MHIVDLGFISCPGARITGIIKVCLILFFSVFMAGELFSQSWKFVKEKEGIKVYTSETRNNSLKSFKGVADLTTSLDKVYTLLGNVRSTDRWDKSIKEFRVLSSEKDKSFSYYLVYGIPWPLYDRDLCVEVAIIHDTSDGSVIISAKSNPKLVPENGNLVRIRDYWQKWIIQPLDNDHVRLTLEGFADPAGNIPSWLYNMVITETPVNTISDIRRRTK